MTDAPLVAGVELGGTKCIAILARGTQIVARAELGTGTPDATLTPLVEQLREWQRDGAGFTAIGIASFGPLVLDPARGDFGRIAKTPKPHWSGADVRGAFARLFDVPVGFDTDVNGAALAEYCWGAGQGCSMLAYLTVGTGIGGGILVDGRPIHGRGHPELGHIRVRRSGSKAFAGICPYHGDCLEGLASGPAIHARTGVAAKQLPDNHPIWDEVAAELGELIAALALANAPERILIGGGVGGRTALLPQIRAAVAARLAGYLPDYAPETLEEVIVSPGLGADAGPLGAAALALLALSSASSPGRSVPG